MEELPIKSSVMGDKGWENICFCYVLKRFAEGLLLKNGTKMQSKNKNPSTVVCKMRPFNFFYHFSQDFCYICNKRIQNQGLNFVWNKV
jgi:hypothetical protein